MYLTNPQSTNDTTTQRDRLEFKWDNALTGYENVRRAAASSDISTQLWAEMVRMVARWEDYGTVRGRDSEGEPLFNESELVAAVIHAFVQHAAAVDQSGAATRAES
jgi:hypothetical protein